MFLNSDFLLDWDESLWWESTEHMVFENLTTLGLH